MTAQCAPYRTDLVPMFMMSPPTVRSVRDVRSRPNRMAGSRWPAKLPAWFVVFAAIRFASGIGVQALPHSASGEKKAANTEQNQKSSDQLPHVGPPVPTRWTVAASGLHCRRNIHKNSVHTLSDFRRSVVGCDLLKGTRILRFPNRGRRHQPGVMWM